jgi:hypothetical protein
MLFAFLRDGKNKIKKVVVVVVISKGNTNTWVDGDSRDGKRR